MGLRKRNFFSGLGRHRSNNLINWEEKALPKQKKTQSLVNFYKKCLI